MRLRSSPIAFALAALATCAASAASQGTPEPRFADAARVQKLASAFPEVDRLFASWVGRMHMPGAAMGIILDGQLAWVKTAGVTDIAAKTAVTPDSVFRIASMTKSFTALAILKLRDEGKLSLDDPVSKYVPELAGLRYPTTDSPVLTIRHLLTHSEGFPEDNPWGDRQLAQPQSTMSAWMKNGIPFSTVPGTAFEYSNYGFAILGQVVERVSKQSYDVYLARNILSPLQLKATTLHLENVLAERRANGYRWEDDQWTPEPALPHGTYGAMGGLWTSLHDLASYVAYHMSAWPPRNAPESGPVKRSSLREQQQAWRWQRARATRSTLDQPLDLSVAAYGYGLRISQNCRFGYVVSHGGGLPGFGSLMLWLPDYGVGLVAMANVTYASWGGLFNDALNALAKTGALQPRVVQPSAALLRAKAATSKLVTAWDAQLASQLVADNFFLDQSAERWEKRLSAITETHGACTPDEPLDAENALRGTWRMNCERGWLRVSITLAPTEPPRVQYLQVHSMLPPGPAMSAAIEASRGRIASEASAWGACRIGEAIGGDGMHVSSVRLACDKGNLVASYRLDDGGQLKELTLSPANDQPCVP
ncbi:MAG: serine hydrolase domain-containing protein [Acidobacteriota bacterium]